MDVLENGIITPFAQFGKHRRGNYAAFEEDGTLRFAGQSTYWRDVDFPLIARTSQAGHPTPAAIATGINAPTWDIDDYIICEGQELVHEWKEGTPLYWHLHIISNGLEEVAKFLKFKVEFVYAIPNGVISAVQTITSGELEIPADTVDRTHFIFGLGITNLPINAVIGTHIYPRLTRIASVGAAPVADPFSSMLQIHIECDTIGSRTMTAK